MKQRIISYGAAGLLLAAAAVVGVVTALPAAAAPVICEKYGSTTVSGGRYIVQNNNWGDDTTQCIDVNQNGPGFAITTASHNKATNGAPGSYPSVYFGCHYANCSSGSGLPLRADTSTFNGLSTSVSMSYPSAGVWDAAYDIWFDPTARTDGQNTGAEIMIWLSHLGPIQPVGSKVATATINGATWDVWFGNIGWNVISYVRQSATGSLNFTVNEFYTDSVNRGYAQRSWYLTSIQAGFEPWVGQTGLVVNSFSVTSGGGGGDNQAPTTPTNLIATSAPTSTSVNLSWSASSDNVGVTGYDILRAAGTSGGSFATVGTATGTNVTASGLSANTSYRFQVRARDAAGNTSAVSNTITVTTTTTGGGGDTQSPSTPTNLSASGTTASSTTLSWTASTDNVGVTAYDVLRAPGTSGGSFTPVGVASTPGFTAAGLAANTTYRFQVRARDAAGNTSSVSNTVTVTTSSDGGGGGASCAATFTVSAWPGAFQGSIAVRNSGSTTLNGWTVTLVFNTAVTVTQVWGGTYTQSGNTVVIRNMPYNGNLGAGATTAVGLLANTSGSNGATATATCTSP